MCGSFCTISEALEQMKQLVDKGYDIYPILSHIVQSENTRFTDREKLLRDVETISGHTPILSVVEAEPIGPKRMFDVLAVCPCTGNTLAKLNHGITDTSVTMAVKAHIRNNRPVVLAVATNDALSASAKNIGGLLNRKNYFFVPFGQDDPINKERSAIADFSLLEETIIAALHAKQYTPIIK